MSSTLLTWLTGVGTAALLLSVPAAAQDHMGMVELHGQGVTNTLSTDIRNSGIRSSMGQQKGGQASGPPAVWPAHINERSAASHVFTAGELQAMNQSDRERARRLLDGKTITVEGRVVLPERERNNSFRLQDGRAAGYVHVNWNVRKNGQRTVRDGQVVRIKGAPDFSRRTYVGLRPTAAPAVPVQASRR